MNGQELKRILQGMGIRQVDLAQKLGTTQQNLSYIFKAASVKTSRLEEIAAALGKDITMFFEGERNEAEITKVRASATPATQATTSRTDKKANLKKGRILAKVWDSGWQSVGFWVAKCGILGGTPSANLLKNNQIQGQKALSIFIIP